VDEGGGTARRNRVRRSSPVRPGRPGWEHCSGGRRPGAPRAARRVPAGRVLPAARRGPCRRVGAVQARPAERLAGSAEARSTGPPAGRLCRPGRGGRPVGVRGRGTRGELRELVLRQGLPAEQGEDRAMNVTTSPPVGTRPGRCGCGGDPGKCRCGQSAPVAVCEMATGHELKRPVFFPGQLLAESDLTAVAEYLLTKLRLRTRYLFGAGVACGLIVVPETDSTVCVKPGYAIDGCGNDVIVPCPQQVNIEDLIRELRQGRRSGDDCPKPIARPGKVEQYDLYIRGHDTPSDYDSPYEFSEGCKTQCFPTRMQEGFAFELRYATDPCDEKAKCGPEHGPAELEKKFSAAAGYLDAMRAVRARVAAVENAIKNADPARLKEAADAAMAKVTTDPPNDRAARAHYATTAVAALPHAARYRRRAVQADWEAFWKIHGPKFKPAAEILPCGVWPDMSVVATWASLLAKPGR